MNSQEDHKYIHSILYIFLFEFSNCPLIFHKYAYFSLADCKVYFQLPITHIIFPTMTSPLLLCIVVFVTWEI